VRDDTFTTTIDGAREYERRRARDAGEDWIDDDFDADVDGDDDYDDDPCKCSDPCCPCTGYKRGVP